MSDQFSPLINVKFQHAIQISNNHSPAYINRSGVDVSKLAMTLTITNDFLRNLQKSKDAHDLTYVEVLNTQIKYFQLKPVKRLESGLQALCSKVINAYRKNYTGGQKRQRFNKETHAFAVFTDELENVQELNCRISKFEEENVLLEKRCQELYHDIRNLTNEYVDLEQEVKILKSKNKELLDYIETIPFKPDSTTNPGINLEDLNSRQYLKQIRTLETYTQKSLWFAETFGLLPEKLTCRTKSDQFVTLNLGDSKAERNNYSSLSEEEKHKIRELVFLVDKFCISDAAYHELSMVSQDMPRSYLLIQSRNELNELYHIERLPGNVPGAYISLKSELERLLKYKMSVEPLDKRYRIKFSGDGAKVSRISNFAIFSVSIVSDESKLSFNKQHTIGIVKCGENYENLSRTCKPIFDQLNELSNKQNICINGSEVNLDFFVGGDLKFLQLILGLSGSTANYTCPWCKVHKNDRHDTSKPWDFYHSSEIRKTVSEISKIASSGKQEFGVKNKPFLTLELDRFIPDELHLMMRITDVLLRNLIDDARDKNVKCMDELVDLIRSCGIVFNVWTPKGLSDIEWTCLSGSERVKLRENLPNKLSNSNIINDDTKDDVVSLWNEFYKLYKFINNTPTDESFGENIFFKIREWIQRFLHLGRFRKGYRKLNITPYMHCFAYHVPYFIHFYGSLKKFSGQGVEKNNDVIKMIHQKKSNKWDAACESLQVRKRIEFGQLENLEREKRSYNKKSDWWERGIVNSRSTKRQKIYDEIAEADSSSNDIKNEDFENMSEFELREVLRKRGISTKTEKVDIFKDEELAKHFHGCDAVASCLGSPDAFIRREVTLYQDSMKSIVAAMRKSEVKRITCITSWCTVRAANSLKIFEWFLRPIMIGYLLDSMSVMEKYLQNECSDIEYTVVRPPMLVNGPSTGKNILAEEGQFLAEIRAFIPTITRRDVARFMLNCLENGEWKQKFVAIGIQ